MALGAYFLARGYSARADIRQELRDEQITTSQDASMPGVLVQDAETARAQADAIKKHTLGTWGPYTALARDDPRRAQYIDGVALRTALDLSVAGFGVADFAVAAGIIIVIAGAATSFLAAPALYLLAGMVIQQQKGSAQDG